MIFLADGGLAERALNRAFALDREHKNLVADPHSLSEIGAHNTIELRKRTACENLKGDLK